MPLLNTNCFALFFILDLMIIAAMPMTTKYSWHVKSEVNIHIIILLLEERVEMALYSPPFRGGVTTISPPSPLCLQTDNCLCYPGKWIEEIAMIDDYGVIKNINTSLYLPSSVILLKRLEGKITPNYNFVVR